MDNKKSEEIDANVFLTKLDLVARRTQRIEELITLLFTDVIETKAIIATMLEFMDIDTGTYVEKYSPIAKQLTQQTQTRISKFYDVGTMTEDHERQILLARQFGPFVCGRT